MRPLSISVEDTRTGATESAHFLRAPVRIGRNPLNDLLLDEPSVSQWHAVVHFDADHVTFVDVGSSNGSALDGQKVTAHEGVPLSEASVVDLGPVRLRFARPSVGATARKTGRLALGQNPFSPKTQVSRPPIEPEDSELPTRIGLSSEDGDDGTRQASSVIEQFRQLQAAIAAVKPLRDRYRQSLKDHLVSLPAEVRSTMIPQLVVKNFPELRNDPEFLELARELGADPTLMKQPTAGEWMAALLGRRPVDSVKVDDAQVLARVAAVLQTFAQAYVELQHGHRRFLEEMGIHQPAGTAAIDEAPDGDALLRKLFDFTEDGDQMIWALTHGFADVATHPVALLQALKEGVRAILDWVSPREVRGQAEREQEQGWLGSILPLGMGDLYRVFVRRHRDLSEGDHFGRMLLGGRFARAYQAVAGGASAPQAHPTPMPAPMQAPHAHAHPG